MTAEIFEVSLAVVAVILLMKPVLGTLWEFQRSYTRLQIQREENRTDLMRTRLQQDLIRQQLRANARAAQAKIATSNESSQSTLAILGITSESDQEILDRRLGDLVD